VSPFRSAFSARRLPAAVGGCWLASTLLACGGAGDPPSPQVSSGANAYASGDSSGSSRPPSESSGAAETGRVASGASTSGLVGASGAAARAGASSGSASTSGSFAGAGGSTIGGATSGSPASSATTGASGSPGGAADAGADAPSDGPPTWTNLYAVDFGPNNSNGCGTMTGSCHQKSGDLGAAHGSNHFVCGTTSESCYAGMKSASLLPNGPVTDVKTTGLWKCLYIGGGAGGDSSNNMPLTGYFDSGALAVIQAWLLAGAADN
jgi:hypothetical protein